MKVKLSCLLVGLALAGPAFADQLSLGPNVDAEWDGTITFLNQQGGAGELEMSRASHVSVLNDRIRAANFDDEYGPWHITIDPSDAQGGFEYISQCAVHKDYAVDCGILVQLTCVDAVQP